MNTSHLRSLSSAELERIRNKLFNFLRQAEGDERTQAQVDICWIQKVMQENADRRIA
jgi:hypothetical protein